MPVPDGGHPRVTPHLHYEDPFAALAWLCQVFGFEVRARFGRGEDNVTARLEGPGGGTVMISGLGDEFKAWMRDRAPRFERATGRSWPQLTHAITVIVDDVDAHYERAEREGAIVLTAPEDQPWGLRTYAALDPQGHQWEFADSRPAGGRGGAERTPRAAEEALSAWPPPSSGAAERGGSE